MPALCGGIPVCAVAHRASTRSTPIACHSTSRSSLLPFLLAGHGALHGVRAAPRRRGPPLLRGPAGRLHRRRWRDRSAVAGWAGEGAVLASALAGWRRPRCLSRRLCRAGRGGRRPVLAALVAAGQHRAVQHPQRADQGHVPHMAAQPQARVALTGWNSYSRIDAVTGFPRQPGAPLHRLGRLDQTCSAGTAAWRAWRRCATGTARCPSGSSREAATLVIGPGGGSDVLVALASGAPRSRRWSSTRSCSSSCATSARRPGSLYDHPRVRDAPLTRAATSSARPDRPLRRDLPGLRGLLGRRWPRAGSRSPRTTSTRPEAFRAYYDHLTDDGALVIMRWAHRRAAAGGQRGGAAGAGGGGAGGWSWSMEERRHAGQTRPR